MIHAILFDLDGTLLDTVPDLLHSLNHIRLAESLPPLSPEIIRPIANLGSKAMVKKAFGIEESHADFQRIREEFLHIYENNIAGHTQFFPQVEEVLDHLDKQQIPWGIVTNKLNRHAMPLLKALGMDHRPACVICGDSLSKAKPDPLPIRHACKLLNKEPENCIYVGDALSDVIASKAAGATSLVALYGYIQADDNPLSWKADGYILEPWELLQWL